MDRDGVVPLVAQWGRQGRLYTSLELQRSVFSGEELPVDCRSKASIFVPPADRHIAPDKRRQAYGYRRKVSGPSHFDPQAGWPWMRAAASDEI